MLCIVMTPTHHVQHACMHYPGFLHEANANRVTMNNTPRSQNSAAALVHLLKVEDDGQLPLEVGRARSFQ